MQDSNPGGLWDRISSGLNARWQTDWAIQDQAKNFGIRTWLWRYKYLLLLISMFYTYLSL